MTKPTISIFQIWDIRESIMCPHGNLGGYPKDWGNSKGLEIYCYGSTNSLTVLFLDQLRKAHRIVSDFVAETVAEGGKAKNHHRYRYYHHHHYHSLRGQRESFLEYHCEDTERKISSSKLRNKAKSQNPVFGLIISEHAKNPF